MPPVHRWASGVCRVPADLPDAARASLGLLTSDPDWWWEQIDLEEGWEVERWNAVWCLRPLFFYAAEFVAVDASYLAIVRNMLDEEVLDAEGCEEHAVAAGVPPPPEGEDCRWCDRCCAITMRDRIDYWLNESGHLGSSYFQAYSGPVDASIEAEWAVVWSGATYPGEAA